MTVPATATRRTRRHPEHWRLLVAEQTASGLNARAFCAERGLPYASFLYWRKKLADEAPRLAVQPGTPGFIELVPTAGAATSPWELELDLGAGITLRLRRA